jgi:hypothetical protein
MSEMGLKTGNAPREQMFSASPLKADIRRTGRDVGSVPIGDIGSPISSGDRALMNPITGIASCCARAESGHAAAPPSRVMN